MAEQQDGRGDDPDMPDVGDAPASDAAELTQIIQGEGLESARSRRRASSKRIDVTISGHVKAPLVLLKARAIDACRRGSGCPPGSGVLETVALSLLGGAADRSEWSADVRRALMVFEVATRRARRRALRVPWAMEQLNAAARIRRERLIHWSVLRKRGAPLPSSEDYEKATEAMAAAEVYCIAQQQCTIAVAEAEERAHFAAEHAIPLRRGRRPKQPKPRSILDRRWDGGHPDEHAIHWRLLEVEVWRDVRAELRQAEGRVSRSEALAEVLLEELRSSDSSRYKRIDNLRRQHEQNGCSPAPALAKAMNAWHGEVFKAIQVRFSQALKSCPSATAAHRRGVGPGRRVGI